MSFTVGQALLVAAPPKMESPEPYEVCLPKGGWYDYWTGLPVDAIGRRAAVATSAAQTVPGAADDSNRSPRRRGWIACRSSFAPAPSCRASRSCRAPQRRRNGPLRLDVYPGRGLPGRAVRR